MGSFNVVSNLKTNNKRICSTSRISWSLLGDQSNPVVVVLGGISANRFVAYNGIEDKQGWWEDFVGDDKAIDTRCYAVLSFDFLGGNSDSAIIDNDGQEPEISTYDQARALKCVLNSQGIQKLHAIVGSSYGGMVSLAFSELYPESIERQLVISAAEASHPRSSALRSVQRQIVRLANDLGDTKRGLALARQLGMITYRSVDEFAERFCCSSDNANAEEKENLQDYLDFQGEKFADKFNHKSFLCLSESIDSHTIKADRITTTTTLVSVNSDELVFDSQVLKLSKKLNGTTNHISLESVYGHDAFLKEHQLLKPIIETLLECHYE